MRAARWDTTWEAGGLWLVVLRWRLGAGPDAPLALLGATRMVLWPASSVTPAGGPTEPTITVTGELAADETSVTLARSSAQTTAAAELGVRRFRHWLLVHDPALADDRVLLRGFVTVAPPEAAP